jgi:hypothetical protein
LIEEVTAISKTNILIFFLDGMSGGQGGHSYFTTGKNLVLYFKRAF